MLPKIEKISINISREEINGVSTPIYIGINKGEHTDVEYLLETIGALHNIVQQYEAKQKE